VTARCALGVSVTSLATIYGRGSVPIATGAGVVISSGGLVVAIACVGTRLVLVTLELVQKGRHGQYGEIGIGEDRFGEEDARERAVRYGQEVLLLCRTGCFLIQIIHSRHE
jgi:hypothetical protein